MNDDIYHIQHLPKSTLIGINGPLSSSRNEIIHVRHLRDQCKGLM